MPNWCSCSLSITGTDRDKVLESIAGKSSAFDFNKVIPMPPQLRIEKGTMSDLGTGIVKGDITKWLSYQWVKDAGIKDAKGLAKGYGTTLARLKRLGRQCFSNIKKYGAPTWYEWSIQNWGTKWPARDAEVSDYMSRKVVTFWTAWDPPMPLIQKLAETWPTCSFTLDYDEDEDYDGTDCRCAVFKNGVMVEHSVRCFSRTAEWLRMVRWLRRLSWWRPL